MGKYKSYDEYIQSDWYKKYMESNKLNKYSKTIPKEVKEKLHKKYKRNRMIDYVLSHK
jgi:hypothetical protein